MYGIQDETGNVNAFNYGELYGAIDVALFVIIVGGFLGVTMKTGAINTGINSLVRSLEGREKLMIPVLMIVFALGGIDLWHGRRNPRLLSADRGGDDRGGIRRAHGRRHSLARGRHRRAGLDHQSVRHRYRLRFRGYLDCRRAARSPDHAGRGHGHRHLLGHALRRAGAQGSEQVAGLRHEGSERSEVSLAEVGRGRTRPLTGKQKIVLVLFFLAFLVMMYGVIPWSDLGLGLPTLWWWFPEMSASFILFSILIGVVGGLGEEGLTNGFVDGARDLLGVALIVGVARGISVVMNNAQITDTVLHWTEDAVSGLGGGKFLILLFLLFIPLSFLIPSSSGLATVTMPIMVPLASFRRGLQLPGGFVLPVRFGTRCAGYPDVCGRHGRAGDCPGALSDLAQVRATGRGGTGILSVLILLGGNAHSRLTSIRRRCRTVDSVRQGEHHHEVRFWGSRSAGCRRADQG